MGSVNIIDPAYVESECTACGGRGVSGDDYTEYLTRCLVCEGTGFAERCPCGERVPMTFVPDQYGVRLCGGEGCDGGAWDRACAVDVAIEAWAAHLLNGGGAHPDDEDEEPETREIPPLPAAELEAERRRGPAPLTDVEAYERGRAERERELATEQESGKGAAA